MQRVGVKECKLHQQDGVRKTGCTYQPQAGRGGFTLLELLVVIAILAAISFIAAGTYRGVGQHADERLVRAEMQQIAKALRQFKQDTGYFPQQGPFGLAIDSGQVVNAGLPDHAKGLTNAAKRRWFYSPANFFQLLSSTSPLNGSGHQLAEWDAETGRGWRGPYLQGFGDGYVDIGDDINPDIPFDPDHPGTEGDPTAGTAIDDVDGLADPFEYRASGSLLDWSQTTRPVAPATTPVRVELESWGRPYLFFQVAADRWELHSMGSNGEYDNGGGDDIVLPIQ